MALQKKGRFLQLVVTLLGKATEKESILPAKMKRVLEGAPPPPPQAPRSAACGPPRARGHGGHLTAHPQRF